VHCIEIIKGRSGTRTFSDL